MLPTVLVDLLAVRSAASSAIFQMDKLPVLSAWSALHHFVPHSATDRSGIDLLWTRLAYHGGWEVLVVPLALVAVALGCFALALRSGSPRRPDVSPRNGGRAAWRARRPAWGSG